VTGSGGQKVKVGEKVEAEWRHLCLGLEAWSLELGARNGRVRECWPPDGPRGRLAVGFWLFEERKRRKKREGNMWPLAGW